MSSIGSVQSLIHLDMDAIKAYEQAIKACGTSASSARSCASSASSRR